MTILRGIAVALGFCAAPLAAQEERPKLFVLGDMLIYDTSNATGDSTQIEVEDVDILRALLQANPEVRTIELNSGGGSVWAAVTITDIVLDFELDTRVNGDCDSSCITIFLAGENRSMTRGSRLGFHQIQWSAENIEEYYTNERADFGWETPWEFSEWMYLDTQQEVYLKLNYMISRGVDPAFAIQSIRKPDSTMWRPHRTVLRAAGVLTE